MTYRSSIIVLEKCFDRELSFIRRPCFPALLPFNQQKRKKKQLEHINFSYKILNKITKLRNNNLLGIYASAGQNILGG